MSRGFDIIALARRIEQRRREFNGLHPDAPVRVSPAMSRILENDPDYLPYRDRAKGKRQQPVRNPTVRTLVQIATALGTTVGDLLGEPWPVSPAERRMLAEVGAVVDRLLAQAKQAKR